MSDHKYEDLAEETIRLLLSSGRRSDALRPVIAGIYRFQALFDTSDTIGRLEPDLRRIGYFENISEPTSILETVACSVELAQAAGDRRLGYEWLAGFAEALSSLDLGDELPRSFAKLNAARETVVIRDAAAALDVMSARPAGTRFRLKSWSGYARGLSILRPESLELKHMLRLVTDPKTDRAKIVEGYEADRAKAGRVEDSPAMRLAEIVPDYGPFTFIARETRFGFGRREHFTFEIGDRPTDPEASRLYLTVVYEVEEGKLIGEVGMQSGLLLKWQGRDFGASSNDIHYGTAFALWTPYAFHKPEKALRKTLATMFENYGAVAKSLEFYRKPLRKLLESHDVDRLLKKQTKLRRDYGFLTNDFDLLFAYACLAWEKGARPEALIRRIVDRLPAVHDDYPLKSAWRDGSDALRIGPWFPPLTERVRYRDLSKD